MYFNAVVVEVKTFILLFRLALLKFVFRKIGCLTMIDYDEERRN